MTAAMAERGTFNPKVLQTLMGDSSITVTYDRYGHLLPRLGGGGGRPARGNVGKAAEAAR
jgi:hypothetical protein